MSLLNILKAMATKKEGVPEVFRSATPLSLHQKAMVALPTLDLVLLQADGSLVPTVESNQIVKLVGKQTLFGIDIFHSYLSDGKSFLRSFVKNGVPELALFVSHGEIIPSTTEDWENWLGKYRELSESEVTAGVDPLVEAGLIGYPQFQIDGPPPVVYDKTWGSTEYYETIYSPDGNYTRVKHEGAEYVRNIGESQEYLLVTMAQHGDEASVDIFVGVPISVSSLKVIA
jgi:hypothetical protein